MRKSALNTSALLRVFAGSGVIKIFQSLLSVLVGVLLARFLEPDGYGRYSFAFAIISLLAIPAQSGLPTLLVREVARLSESQQWQTMKRLILWSGWVIAIVSSILVVIPLVFRVYIESAMGREAFDVFLLGLPLIPILALSYARAGVIKGLSFVLRGQLPELIVLPGVFSVAVLIFGLAGYLSPESAMLLYTGAAVVSFAVGGVLLARVLPQPVKVAKADHGHPSAWIRSMIPLSAISGLQILSGQIDIAVLGVFRAESEVGIYRVASQGALIASIALMAVNGVMGSYIARLFFAKEFDRLQRLVTFSARLVFSVSLPIAMILIFWGGVIVRTVFGSGYEEAALPLAILCIGQLVNAMTGSVGYLLNMTGHERYTAKGVFYAAMLNMVLNFALIPPFGMNGAAVATAITVCVVNVYLYFVVFSLINIDSAAIPVISFIRRSRRI